MDATERVEAMLDAALNQHGATSAQRRAMLEDGTRTMARKAVQAGDAVLLSALRARLPEVLATYGMEAMVPVLLGAIDVAERQAAAERRSQVRG